MDFPVLTPMQLGAVLRGFRRQRGLTQAQLADRVGLTQKAISIIETHPERIGVARVFRVLSALEAQWVLRDKVSARPSPRAQW